MSKRLQVLMDEREWREVQRAAKRADQTTSEWVRQAIRAAFARQPVRSAGRKLTAVRATAGFDFPAPDIEQMNEEIARGYTADPDE